MIYILISCEVKKFIFLYNLTFSLIVAVFVYILYRKYIQVLLLLFVIFLYLFVILTKQSYNHLMKLFLNYLINGTHVLDILTGTLESFSFMLIYIP